LKQADEKWAAEHPDNDSEKDVYLEAAGRAGVLGDRHVQIWWENGQTQTGPVTQIVHLTGGIGNYAFISPTIKPRNQESIKNNEVVPLGTYSRAQRNHIIKLAGEVTAKITKTSRVNDCRAWMRDLLELMVTEKLIAEAKVHSLCETIPLPARVEEPQEEKDGKEGKEDGGKE
jgi:hypothetical protein